MPELEIYGGIPAHSLADEFILIELKNIDTICTQYSEKGLEIGLNFSSTKYIKSTDFYFTSGKYLDKRLKELKSEAKKRSLPVPVLRVPLDKLWKEEHYNDYEVTQVDKDRSKVEICYAAKERTLHLNGVPVTLSDFKKIVWKV